MTSREGKETEMDSVAHLIIAVGYFLMAIDALTH